MQISSSKKSYVVGFLFDEQFSQVVLVKKNRPAWQKGYLNGVGGKIELNESPHDAMVREFEEEAGILISTWNEYAVLKENDKEIYFFWQSFTDISQVKTNTDEPINIYDISKLNTYKIIPNLSWLIPMALEATPIYASIESK